MFCLLLISAQAFNFISSIDWLWRFADLEGKQKRTEGKTVCTYAEA